MILGKSKSITALLSWVCLGMVQQSTEYVILGFPGIIAKFPTYLIILVIHKGTVSSIIGTRVVFLYSIGNSESAEIWCQFLFKQEDFVQTRGSAFAVTCRIFAKTWVLISISLLLKLHNRPLRSLVRSVHLSATLRIVAKRCKIGLCCLQKSNVNDRGEI